MAGEPIRLGTALSAVLVPDKGATLTKSTKGKLDVLRRPFTCPTASIVALVPALYSADSVFTGMYFSEYVITNVEGLHSQLEFIYKGIAIGSPEAAYSEDGLSLETAQAVATVAGSQVNIEAQFYAPTTAWFWVTSTNPINSVAYATVQNTLSPFDYLVSYHITDEDGADGWVPLSDFTAAFNALTQRTLVTNYRAVNVIPGKYWECESTVIKTIQGT